MKRYGQLCAVARALDLVGDRWTLLIVRELLLRPSRFTDLLDGLPRIPRNLLAGRLRTLVDAGLVDLRGTRYSLTARGEQLRPVIRSLAGFGAPEVVRGAQGDDVRGRWIATAVDARFGDDPGVEVLQADDAHVVLSIHGSEISGSPEEVIQHLAKGA